jgi:phosphoribosylanthranilate isomerase
VVIDPVAPGSAGPLVKICGLVRVEDVEHAARSGAAFVGSIFAGGPRRVSPADARRTADAARAAARAAGLPAPQAVVVFGAPSPGEVARLAGEAAADVVQLHADPDAALVAATRREWAGPVWAALRIAGTAVPAHAADLFAAADAVVVDARVAGGALGGTGVALPWAELADALAAVRGATPVVLAGGLRSANVAAAVAALGPDVVDVSSGVEAAPGVKDHAEVLSFILRARQPRAGAPSGGVAAGAPPAA